jgi:predicted aspartyl protease
MNKARVLTAFFSLIGCSTSQANSLETSFDFSRSEIGIEVSIRGKTLYAILDTGVDPSVINLADAEELGLKVDRTVSGEASGFGEGRGVTVFPTRIEGLTIRGHRFATFDALASDTATFT